MRGGASRVLSHADSDIQSAHGEPTRRQRPSEAALAVYDEIVRQEEAQADCEAERFSEEQG